MKKEKETPQHPEDQSKTKEDSVEVKILEGWQPRTLLGKQVKAGERVSLEQILRSGERIMEPEIVEALMPRLESELLLIGQAKGKFGGGQRRVFLQTQKKTKEGNKPKFSTCAVVGNKDGIVGVGFGKAKETVPAKEKALRNAKLNVMHIIRGSGSWASRTDEPHSIPFAVEGKCGSVRIKLMPAPRGKGLVAEKEVAKILRLAGIEDIWTKTRGQTKNKINLVKAAVSALTKLHATKVIEEAV